MKKEKKKKRKKKLWFFLTIYKFEAYELSHPEKLLNKFLVQWKNQLVSENWRGYEERKVCKAPVQKLTNFLDRIVQSALTN